MCRSPAEITVSASRYLMMNGRSLPSEGLAIQQICEAIRDAGLAPVLLRAAGFDVDRPALDTFLRSGFPVVLAIREEDKPLIQEGHAICAVGAKLGEIRPQADPGLNYRDGATALEALYVHDDRLGPYALAKLAQKTIDRNTPPSMMLRIHWPGAEEDYDTWRLIAMVVPVPNKVRLSVTRLRQIAHIIGQALGAALPDMQRSVTVRTRYTPATLYLQSAFAMALSETGLDQLVIRTVLSRYVAVIEVEALGEPLIDVLLDCTEAVERPSCLAVINRSSLPASGIDVLRDLATQLGAPFIA
jgi:hypothetical protein